MAIKRNALAHMVNITVAVTQADGSLKTETQAIAHKPIPQDWLMDWERRRKVSALAVAAKYEALAERRRRIAVGAEAAPPELAAEIEAEIAAIQAEQRATDTISQLADILLTTGLEDDAGQLIAPTVENLRQIDLPYLLKIEAEITKKLDGSRESS